LSQQSFVRYQGFTTKSVGREYTFEVNDAKEEPREFTLTIANDAFITRRVRFQEAPEICSLKLRRELAAEEADPSKTPAKLRYRISEAEIEEYREAHSPRMHRGAPRRKPAPKI
jgi:hypothetical protein